MTRAQCSVEIEGRGNSTRKVGGRKKVTVDARTQLRRMAAAEPRVPIGKKFVHKRSSVCVKRLVYVTPIAKSLR